MDGHAGDGHGDGHGSGHGSAGEREPDESAAMASVASAALVGRVDYPMFVVTALSDGEPSGCLAGFVTQCSIVPARFLVCISKRNHTAGVAAGSDALGVHLLGRDQLDLARVFGELTGDRDDKFSLVSWHRGVTGVPVLEECAAWLEGPVAERLDLGDHVGHLVEPVAGGGGGAAGELWYSSARHLTAGHPPTG